MGGVLFTPEYRDLEEIKHAVSGLMQEHEIGLANEGVFRCDPTAGGLLWCVLLDEIDIFVATGHHAVVIPRVDHAAIDHLEREVSRQLERAEQQLHALQRLAL